MADFADTDSCAGEVKESSLGLLRSGKGRMEGTVSLSLGRESSTLSSFAHLKDGSRERRGSRSKVVRLGSDVGHIEKLSEVVGGREEAKEEVESDSRQGEG